MKPKKLTVEFKDPQAKAVWDAVQRATAEVKDWPAWKRGEAAAPAEVTPAESSKQVPSERK